jgi:hypothetical protein
VRPFPRNNVWAYNPQAGLFYALTESGKAHFTYARKTRLPTIKDRFSYRMGQAVPNPDLREERSDNLEAGYTQVPDDEPSPKRLYSKATFPIRRNDSSSSRMYSGCATLVRRGISAAKWVYAPA